MTCRLSDLARGEAARFEPRNDRHRRSEEDEEKDRTEAADKRERDGYLEEVNASETARSKEAKPPKDSISRTSSPRQTGRIRRSFSEFSRGPRVSRPQKIDTVTGERRSVLSGVLPLGLDCTRLAFGFQFSFLSCHLYIRTFRKITAPNTVRLSYF
ncbi:hypothetical protein ALC56_03348 [Trachymyrmex septentrionalis]|uniref:Uncharacterized protein n=1 Tax=Trachymyrmex septentrionalis TaxID=34720 RepID=A0A195FNT5_9HYME|nr:hypothetical protein ALC56_03348 [Trachymyrmex septentrionalis]